MMMVILPLVAGSEGGPVRRPSLRRLRHAEGPGEIEMGGGCSKPLPAQSAR